MMKFSYSDFIRAAIESTRDYTPGDNAHVDDRTPEALSAMHGGTDGPPPRKPVKKGKPVKRKPKGK